MLEPKEQRMLVGLLQKLIKHMDSEGVRNRFSDKEEPMAVIQESQTVPLEEADEVLEDKLGEAVDEDEMEKPELPPMGEDVDIEDVQDEEEAPLSGMLRHMRRRK